MDNDFYVIANGTTRLFHVSHWVYSAYEIKTMLRNIGFEAVKIYGSLTGTAYDQTASRLIAVAQKGR